ncbi:MAG: hypothetical protein ACJA05_000622 [Porticoccus sp.]
MQFVCLLYYAGNQGQPIGSETQNRVGGQWMKFLLLALVLVGVLYVVLIGGKKTSVSAEQPAAIYQREVERVEKLDDFLQDTVDRQGSEMDVVK